MLTRLEVDGFKTFEKLDVSFEPFSVVLGSNASGKSNLFDVILLLSNLAYKDVNEATRHLRGEPLELFRETPGGRVDRIAMAAEVLIDPVVVDAYGSRVELAHTRLRYELVLERRRTRTGTDRLFVVEEFVRPIRAGDDPWVKARGSGGKRSPYIRYSSRDKNFLETVDGDSGPEFRIRQDGKAGRQRPANAAEATVLYGITNSQDFPHLFALREELANWRLLQLDPALLRRPVPATASEELESDGANLAAVLAAIKAETADESYPMGTLTEITADLASLVGGITRVDADFDEGRREYRLELETRDTLRFSSRVLSDGTLRILALLTLLHDPRRRGLICFEEPENGIHPARVALLIEMLRDMVTNLAPETEPEGAEEDCRDSLPPLAQLLLNSHSPVVLSALLSENLQPKRGASLLFADTLSVTSPNGGVRRLSRLRPVARSRPAAQGSVLDAEPMPPPAVVLDHEVRKVLDTVILDG